MAARAKRTAKTSVSARKGTGRARRAQTKSESLVRDASVDERDDSWALRLYVTGQTPKSLEAFANLKRICEEHLKGRYVLEVIDLLREPALARGDQILAVPTLVRRLPQPVKKLIGDLSNTERVLVGLNLRPLKTPDEGG